MVVNKNLKQEDVSNHSSHWELRRSLSRGYTRLSLLSIRHFSFELKGQELLSLSTRRLLKLADERNHSGIGWSLSQAWFEYCYLQWYVEMVQDTGKSRSQDTGGIPGLPWPMKRILGWLLILPETWGGILMPESLERRTAKSSCDLQWSHIWISCCITPAQWSPSSPFSDTVKHYIQ